MPTWPKATFVMTGACTAVLCGLAGCNKAPSQGGATPQGTATAESSATPEAPLTAGLQEPRLEVPTHGNNPEVAAMAQKYVQWIIEKARPAGLHKPSFPDPNRTDSAALLQRYKYMLWGVAETKLAGDAGVKQAGESLSLDKPAPKGNFGHMAEGLPQLSSDHK
jgi:hypothetical protein